MSFFNLEGEDPSDAEIAELKAEIARLRATIARQASPPGGNQLMSVAINIHQVNQIWATRSKPGSHTSWISIHCRDHYGQEHEVTYFCRDADLADAIYATLPQGDPTERPQFTDYQPEETK